MKKVLIFPLVLVLWLALPLSAPAEPDPQKTWNIPELDLRITLPGDYPVVTLTESSHDQLLAALEIDLKELRAELRAEDIYFWALDPDLDYTLTINMMESAGSRRIWTFENLTDQALQSFGEKLNREGEELSKLGESSAKPAHLSGSAAARRFMDGEIRLTYGYIYRNQTTAFLVLDVELVEDGLVIYARQYSTFYNGRCINIRLIRPDGQGLDERQNQVLKAAVDSLIFTIMLRQPDRYKATGSSSWDYLIGAAAAGLAIAAGTVLLRRVRSKPKK